MQFPKISYLTLVVGSLMLLIQLSCKDCKNPGRQTEDPLTSTYQVALDGINPGASFEDLYTFSIKNQDNKNAVATEEIILSVTSIVAVKLNNHLVNSSDNLLKDIIGPDKLDKEATKSITLQVVDAKRQVAATVITLQLKDKKGNKLGEEKQLIWKPKQEVQLVLSVSKQDLEGNEASDRTIGCIVTKTGAALPAVDKALLELIPEPGTSATIIGTGVTTTTDGLGRKNYNYVLQQQEIGKKIDFQIEPHGDSKATFIIRLIYDGKLMGSEQAINWKGSIPPQGVQVTQEMIDATVPGKSPYYNTRRLNKVLEALSKRQVPADEINQADNLSTSASTALTQAIEIERPDIVRLLLEKGADVNQRSKAGYTPLAYAVNKLNEEIVRLLLGHPGIQNKKTDGNNKDTLLMLAITGNRSLDNRESVITPLEQLLLAQLDKSDIDKKYIYVAQYGENLLCLAIGWGRFALAQALLDKGADPNPQVTGVNTPLRLAILNNAKDLARSLVLKGAQTNVSYQPGGGGTLWDQMVDMGWDPDSWK